MNQRFSRMLAWLCLVVIAVATLDPIGLRPETPMPASLERIAAFAIVGLAFTTAYPRRFWLALILTVGAAVLLELMQVLTLSRHTRLIDAVEKTAGGVLGSLIGYLCLRFRDFWRNTTKSA